MKRNPNLNYACLPMENAYNVRELGGYATKKGSVTNHHQFLRSENLTDITEEDKTFLIEYGLSAIIDLRSREEAKIRAKTHSGKSRYKKCGFSFCFSGNFAKKFGFGNCKVILYGIYFG